MPSKKRKGERPKTTPADRIKTLEAKLGCKIPKDYKEYLEEHNGGTPTPSGFAIPKLQEESLVDVLYGIGLEPELDILAWMEEMKGDIPRKSIPIGCDPGGNVLLMVLSRAGKSPIFYWDATRYHPSSTDENNAYLVASSFSEFLKNLN